jgi:hypothetical protein
MPPTLCPFCSKPSPLDAKFCSACGGALYLAPCPNCGAVNDASAASCYQCRTALPGRNADEDAAPMAGPTKAEARSGYTGHARIAAGVAALVLVGTLGYYAFQQLQLRQAASAAGGQAVGHVKPAADGVVRPQPAVDPGRGDERPGRDTAAAVPAAAKSPANGLSASSPAPAVTAVAPAAARSAAAASPAAPARANAGRAAVLPPRMDRQTVESPRPRPAAASQGAESRECTAAVAALGLCKPAAARSEPPQAPAAAQVSAGAQASAAAKAPETAPAAVAAKARSAKPAPATVRQGEPCTEAVAALGLCTPASKDTGKGE